MARLGRNLRTSIVRKNSSKLIRSSFEIGLGTKCEMRLFLLRLPQRCKEPPPQEAGLARNFCRAGPFRFASIPALKIAHQAIGQPDTAFPSKLGSLPTV